MVLIVSRYALAVLTIVSTLTIISVSWLWLFRLPSKRAEHATVNIPSLREKNEWGYVLATHYSDELTGSCSNLQSLQCFMGSSSRKVRVVEPFLHKGSILGVDLSGNSSNSTLDPENTVTLSDLYDADQWYEYGMMHGYATLVSWRYFLDDAPQQMILLDRFCVDKSNTCMACQNDFYRSDYFLDSAQRFAGKNNFSIVRKSCYNWSSVYDAASFLELAYGPFAPEESILLINHFGGIKVDGDEYRIRIKNTTCNRTYMDMPRSGKIMNSVSNYIKKFLPKRSLNGYISVMIRMQYFAIKHNLTANKAKNYQIRILKHCLSNIAGLVIKLKNERNISSVFLATDTGKYGTTYFRDPSSHILENGVVDSVMGDFYEALFGGFLTENHLTAWIEAVIPVQSSGYVALVEQNLAANGTCLLLAGGGQFQRSALKLHKRNSNNCTISEIEGC